ncbi:MAG: flagellar FlbD family protein [bacterium]|nr:flagellar FlbD family protein [bacterium]
MIKVTRLDDSEFWVNAHQIEFMEQATDNTVVSLASGKKIVVREKTDELLKKIIDYRKKINYFKQEE